MKSLLPAILCALLATPVFAQVHLAQSDYQRFYNASSVRVYNAVGLIGAVMDVGEEGGGNFYDLNGYTFEKDVSECSYVDPSLTPFAARFTSSTHALCTKTKYGSRLTFYRLAGDGLYFEGSAGVVDGLPVVYSAGLDRLVMKFPAQVGTAWDYYGEREESSPGCATQLTTHYDVSANGSISVGFVVEPCIRLRIVDETIHETVFNGQMTRTVTKAVRYMFVSTYGTIATAEIDTMDAASSTPKLLSLQYLVHIPGSVPVRPLPAAAAIQLGAGYPNPVSAQAGQQVRFNWSMEQAGSVRLAVYDVTGRERAVLFEGRTAAGTHTASFEPAACEPGTYFVRLQCGSEAQVRKLSVMR